MVKTLEVRYQTTNHESKRKPVIIFYYFSLHTQKLTIDKCQKSTYITE